MELSVFGASTRILGEQMDPASRSIPAICAEFVDSLPISEPFTLTSFVNWVSERTGKRIQLVATRVSAIMPCGLLARSADVDYIGYPANTSTPHQLHVVLHELGHVILDHVGRPVRVSPNEGALETLRRYLPDLPPALIQHVLGRTSYQAAAEGEAERFATLVGRRLLTKLESRAIPHDSDVDRLRPIFDALPRLDDRG